MRWKTNVSVHFASKRSLFSQQKETSKDSEAAQCKRVPSFHNALQSQAGVLEYS